jgi:hypothetical protein
MQFVLPSQQKKKNHGKNISECSWNLEVAPRENKVAQGRAQKITAAV